MTKRDFQESSVSEFLDLSAGEALLVELRVRLAEELRNRREAQGLTQAELAELRDTTQSHISEMEQGESSVTLDAIVSTLGALGADQNEIGRAITEESRP